MRRLLSSPRTLGVVRTVGVVLLVLAVLSNGVAIRVALRADAGQREGRDIARDFSCATTSAVIDAGIATIKGGGRTISPEFERNLRRLGYPPLVQRQLQADLAAAAYARAVATRVQSATGRTDLVREDGSLNCARLRAVTKP